MDSRGDCPTKATLHEYVLGKLTEAESNSITEHLGNCDRCRTELSLLSSHSEPTVESPTRPLTERVVAPEQAPPEPPAGYAIEGELARGGMGIIYRAQDLRLFRTVAIKVLRPDLADSPALVQRFLMEAHITARLQHPAVPSIYELGTLPDGRPYLAMRLIEGQTLSRLLRRGDADGESRGGDNQDDNGGDRLWHRLAVFEQVCHAIAYAHSQGVIHRDLKPSNVMVGRFGEVQVMDWGLAKVVRWDEEPPSVIAATSGSTVEAPAVDQVTLSGTAVGTPEYMPPEQARGDVEAMDERSDVFGLGAMLLHILTGRPPYLAASRQETLRKAREADLSEAWQALDACRAGAELVALCRRCLAPDPANRPQTAAEVADEIARIRADAERRARQAELARERAAVLAEQERKRRRLIAVALLAVIAVLTAGVAGTTWGWLAAVRARQLAAHRAVREAAARKAAEEARALAEKRLQQLANSNQILLQIFEDIDLRQIRRSGQPLETVLGQRLALAADQLRGETVGDPVLVARMQHRLADTLVSLGFLDRAEPILRQALDTLRQERGANHPDTRAARFSLAALLLAKAAYDEAAQLLEELLAEPATDDPPGFGSAVREQLAHCYRRMGRLDEAIDIFEEVVAERSRRLGIQDIETLRAMHSLAIAYRELGRAQDAVRLLEQVLPVFASELGPNHPDTVDAVNELAGLYRRTGQVDKAIELYETYLAKIRQRVGEDHPDVLALSNNLALAYGDRGQYDRAIELLKRVLARSEPRFGPDHPEVLAARQNLASAYAQTGRADQAVPILEDVVERKKRVLGSEHPSTLRAINQLALAYSRSGRRAEAVRCYEEGYRQAINALGNDHPVTVLLATNLAHTYLQIGRLDDGLRLLEQVIAWRKQHEGLGHRDTIRTLTLYGALLQQAKRLPEAERAFREALQGARELWGDEHVNTLQIQRNVAVTRFLQGAADEAISLFEETLRGLEKAVGPNDRRTLDLMDNLAAAYRAVNRIEEATETYRKLLERRSRALGPNDPQTQLTAVMLAATLRAAGEPNEAIELLEPIVRNTQLAPRVRRLAVRVLSAAYKDVGRTADARRLSEEPGGRPAEQQSADTPREENIEETQP